MSRCRHYPNSFQKQPALISGNVRDVADPDFVRLGHAELTIEQVGRNRQLVIAVGGDFEAPFSLGANAVRKQPGNTP